MSDTARPVTETERADQLDGWAHRLTLIAALGDYDESPSAANDLVRLIAEQRAEATALRAEARR